MSKVVKTKKTVSKPKKETVKRKTPVKSKLLSAKKPDITYNLTVINVYLPPVDSKLKACRDNINGGNKNDNISK